MGLAEVVELLPGSKFLVQINIIGVRQQRVEFFLVGAMRPLYLAIQLLGSRLDLYVLDSHILHVPMETNLPLMTTVHRPVLRHCLSRSMRGPCSAYYFGGHTSTSNLQQQHFPG